MNKQEIELEFTLDSVSVENFRLLNEEVEIQRNAHIGFGLGVGFDVKEIEPENEKDSYQVNLSLSIDTLYRKTNPIELCNLKLVTTFKVRGEGLSEINEKEKAIPKDLIVTMISITYSTARGIYFEKVNDTRLEGILLPIINPSKFIEEPNQIKSIEK